MKIIGSQRRETLAEGLYDLVELKGEPGSRQAILRDVLEDIEELWVENDHYAGYVVEIDGVGFEFVSSNVKGTK